MYARFATILGTLLVALPVLLAGCDARPAARAAPLVGQFVRLSDGRRLHLKCSGHGRPTVILESGFAATARAWFKVQPIVAQTTLVCSYDRAGYGLSDGGPLPRDGRAVVNDLDQALRRANIGGPFVLVGHSAGALYMQLFADRRPNEVVGMVLVDPSVKYQDRRFADAFGPGAGSIDRLRARAVACLHAAQRRALPSLDPALVACTPRPTAGHPAPNAADLANALRPDNWRTQISELDTLWGATSDEVSDGRSSYGDMPLVVLTADGTYSAAPPSLQKPLLKFWRQLHAEIAARSSRGIARLVTHSSHLMMLDRPDAIIKAIQEVITQSRHSIASTSPLRTNHAPTTSNRPSAPPSK